MIHLRHLFTVAFALSVGACATTPKNTGRAKALLTRAQAETRARQVVPDGIVKEAELEEERGLLVWSFDLVRPHTRNITEVQIDARSGKLVHQEIESPQQQALELARDKARKH